MLQQRRGRPLPKDARKGQNPTMKGRQELTTRHTYAWTSNMVYSRLPLYAGFFVAPEGRGAKVVAAFLANFDTWTDRQI